jgi:hypothetical protein
LTPAIRSKHALSLLVAAALALPALAQAAALDQFRSFVSSTKTARGEFSQRLVKNDNGNARVSSASTGTFEFSRPGKFIWIYRKPYEQQLQADGDAQPDLGTGAGVGVAGIVECGGGCGDGGAAAVAETGTRAERGAAGAVAGGGGGGAGDER